MHIRLSLFSVFACVYKFPIIVMGTAFSIQHIDQLKEVVCKRVVRRIYKRNVPFSHKERISAN